jgi:hypothetical protein
MHSRKLYNHPDARILVGVIPSPTLRRPWFEVVSFCGLVASCAASTVVKVAPAANGAWQLLRDGEPYVVRGAGGDTHLDVLKKIGGTTIRTWGIDQLDREVNGKSLLERCQELGLTVMAGIWIEHSRHGFDYSNPELITRQRDAVRACVRRYKNHPAILMWGLGNEMEGPNADGSDTRVWRELEQLARIVKEEDPDHPICTVIAGAATPKVQALMRDYPSLDILGVNAYGAAAEVGKAVAEAGWIKPFILAEFGPVGHWEVGQTPWGAPIEPLAREKAANYYTAHKSVLADSQGRCLGTFAFVWGQKQETTATWYGMFLATGEKLPAVDAVAYAWSGKWPSNRSPRIERLEASFAEGTVAPLEKLTAAAVVSDKEGDRLSYDWQVVAESTDRKEGGDHENAPPTFPECVVKGDGPRAELLAPSKPGPYRVFLYVRDGKGGASADNFPFLVK